MPTGTICSPGKIAIDAAKNPEKSDYYYFFYGKDTKNHYSTTLSEHDAKIKEIGVG